MALTNDLPAILGGTPVRPNGPPDWPGSAPDVVAAVTAALADGSWGRYHGPHVARLSQELASFHDLPHAILCASGTAALELALRGLAIGPGDEVILAAYDFKGNFQDVLAVGATPVLVDVRPDNWNLDVDLLPEAIGPKTKALIVSHLHGGVDDMPAVMRVAAERQLAVIEDAAQMPGTCGLTIFQNPPSDSQPGYYKVGFQFEATEFGGLSREAFAAAVRAEGIALDAGFRALHKTHSSRRFRSSGELPHAARADE